MAQQIQLRRDTAANWTTANPTLANGEMGLETDTRKMKIGNGTSAWNTLGYHTPFPFTTRSATSGSYIYTGRANPGTAENASGWTIKRTETNSKGDIVANLTASGAWSNRTSLTYA